MTMKLEVASWEIVPEMLKILFEHFPDTKTSYSKLQFGYQQLSKFKESCYILLTPEGLFDPFATFVLLDLVNETDILFDTLNPDWAQFSAAMAECPLINWSLACVGPIHPRLAPLFEDFKKRAGMECCERCQHCHDYFAYHISSETALSLKIQLPDDVSLRILREDDANLINQLWPYGGTAEALKRLKCFIRRTSSIGLVSKETGKLLAYVIQCDYGAPGMLHVMEGQRRKGYGEIVLSSLTRQMAQNGFWPKSYILLENIASQKLFEKLGYTRLDIEKWHYLEPKGKSVKKINSRI